MRKRWWVVVGALLLAACGSEYQAVREQDHEAFQRGQRLVQMARHDEALEAFLVVIHERQEAPESHLEAGLIYLNQLHDPVSAIYHLRAFLRLAPQAPQVENVQQLLESAKKDFARELPAAPFQADLDRLELFEQLTKARQENEQLRRQVAELQASIERLSRPPALQVPASVATVPVADIIRPASPPAAPVSPPPTASSTTTYTVKSGDTLVKISSEVYGDGRLWQQIYNANRGTLRTPHDMQIGQVLVIPPR